MCKSIIFFYHLSMVCMFISNFDPSLTAQGRNMSLLGKEHVYNNTRAEYYLQKSTFTWINVSSNQYFQAVIYRSCGRLLASEKEGKNSLNDHRNSVTKLATCTYHVGLNYSPKLYIGFCPHCLGLTVGIVQNYFLSLDHTYQQS